jgi:polar amino acid transport system substrate-binding protein
VVIAVEQKCEPLWLWGPLLAALTGAGGGILRDIVRADVHNPNLKGDFYPEIAVIWGLFLSLFLDWETSRLDLREIGWGVLFTMIGAFLTRLVVLRYGIRSLRLGKPVRS